MKKASDIQLVEFALGRAVLTPPIPHGGRFLSGERITLAGEEFVVTDDVIAAVKGANSTKQAVRRVPVVAVTEWHGPLIDREFIWPAEPARGS